MTNIVDLKQRVAQKAEEEKAKEPTRSKPVDLRIEFRNAAGEQEFRMYNGIPYISMPFLMIYPADEPNLKASDALFILPLEYLNNIEKVPTQETA